MKSEEDKTLVGVLSKKDLSKPGKVVRDVYSSPPVAAKPGNKVADAACLMLKHKVRNGHLISRLRRYSYVLAMMQTFQKGMRSRTYWWEIYTQEHTLGSPQLRQEYARADDRNCCILAPMPGLLLVMTDAAACQTCSSLTQEGMQPCLTEGFTASL